MSVEYSYDREPDSLYIQVKEGKEEEFEEIVPGINVEMDSDGQVIGIEIFELSSKTSNTSV